MDTKAEHYHGSCICKRVRFEADIDLQAEGTLKCNCTACWKRRAWGTLIKPDAFKAISGDDVLSNGARGGFCRECGVRPYAIASTDGWGEGFGGDIVSINIACLDDLPVETLLAAPVKYCDGRNDNWWHAPDEVRHL